MYDRTWLKTYYKRLPGELDLELERRLGVDKGKTCDNCGVVDCRYRGDMVCRRWKFKMSKDPTEE